VAHDIDYIKRALQLADKGRGYTSPNPMVGAVLVKDGRIIGEGYHAKYGQKHAEVTAIENATEPIEGATLYCNLEPCCHDIPGKNTPPCTQRIIKEKIKRVVISTVDPNPYVNGKGIQELQEAGIRVEKGIAAPEAIKFNEIYFKFIQTRHPFVRLKIAQSLDGRIATKTGDSRWITNQAARKLVHQWRAAYDAILIGKNTLKRDNPSLTVRWAEGQQPYRIVLDAELSISPDSPLLRDEFREKTLIFTAEKWRHAQLPAAVREARVLFVPGDEDGFLQLRAVLEKLAQLRITSVLVEGGATVFTRFVSQRLFDKLSVFIAPIIIGKGVEAIGDLNINALSDAFRLEEVEVDSIEHQVLVQGYRSVRETFGILSEEL